MAPGEHSLPNMFYSAVGTAMCISSANVLNQWMEVPFDAQMSRTKNRPLVRCALTPFHAFNYGVTLGAFGTGILCVKLNSLVAALGFGNIILYSFFYTASKRLHVVNTWIGAVVGAIPPMMGWAACTVYGCVNIYIPILVAKNVLHYIKGNLEDGAWLLGTLLYVWQFPHFNSLSWNLRKDYGRAGYQMMSVIDPALSKRVAIRHTLMLFPVCGLCVYCGLTEWKFLITSFAINTVLLYHSWSFFQCATKKTGRRLFFVSIIHLPALLCLLMLHKKKRKPLSLIPTTCEHEIS
ncbi:protoheme IX farnesyltransferase, mitochondrial-like isoform X2 [Zophobas morio]|uniref:protoheme IX farnesyltransferase, mitochondrial-like isoform X2 n=1 Tax=Zophobas morio TaxID=2755281 RepID=UPI003082A20D